MTCIPDSTFRRWRDELKSLERQGAPRNKHYINQYGEMTGWGEFWGNGSFEFDIRSELGNDTYQNRQTHKAKQKNQDKTKERSENQNQRFPQEKQTEKRNVSELDQDMNEQMDVTKELQGSQQFEEQLSEMRKEKE